MNQDTINVDVTELREKIRKCDYAGPLEACDNKSKKVVFPCDPRYCTSCRACIQVCPVNAIVDITDEKGFYSIKVDVDKCIGCMKCEEICHANKSKDMRLKMPIKAYAARTNDLEVLKRSSSGGIFTELASEKIRKGGVVVGAAFDDVFSVRYKVVRDIKGLVALNGSKYVQCAVGDIFSTVKGLLDDTDVLFCGTPCIVSGLKAFVKNDERLTTIDLVCHGVPSPMFFSDYRSALVDEYGKMSSFSFRDKTSGWQDFSLSASFESGDKYLRPRMDDIFFKGFIFEFINRDVCHRCQYARPERVGDITLCDYWGYADGVFEQDDMGISACMVNTIKGSELFESIKDKIVCHETDAGRIRQGNRPLNEPSKINPDRDLFWNDYLSKGFDFVCSKWLSR